MINFYNLLGIHSNANNDEIKKAYREKSKVFHPDVNSGSEASNEMFKMLGLAKDTLLDAAKRLEHDYSAKVKERPTIIKEVVKQKDNTNAVIGWSLVALTVGMIIGRDGNS